MNRPVWTWHGIKGSGIDAIWPVVWACLEKAVARTGGRHDEASVLDGIRNGDMQLWMAGPLGNTEKLAVTTEIVQYPRQKWARILFVGGEGLPMAFGFLGTIEAWAKAQGCVGVEGIGRPEWSRLLQRNGYDEAGRLYQRIF